GQQLLLPGRHLARMDAEFGRQLGRRPIPPSRRQGHLRLERSPKHTPLPAHPGPLLISPSRGCCLHLISAPSLWGPPHKPVIISFRTASAVDPVPIGFGPFAPL